MIPDSEGCFQPGCGRCNRLGTADCSARKRHHGLTALRLTCHAAGLTEPVKRPPGDIRQGRNIAITGAFRGDFRLTFVKTALLRTPKAR
jgi:hypothetical protein